MNELSTQRYFTVDQVIYRWEYSYLYSKVLKYWNNFLDYFTSVELTVNLRTTYEWREFRCMYLLYNCRMIFFILSFFVGYILSIGFVRLRTIWLSARASTHIEHRCSRLHAEDVTITDVVIKTPDGKWDWSANDIMPGSNELGFLVILKKSRVEFSAWGRLVENWNWASWDSTLEEASWFLSLGKASPVGL